MEKSRHLEVEAIYLSRKMRNTFNFYISHRAIGYHTFNFLSQRTFATQKIGYHGKLIVKLPVALVTDSSRISKITYVNQWLQAYKTSENCQVFYRFLLYITYSRIVVII